MQLQRVLPLVIVTLLLLLTCPVTAAPLFGDVPSSHWAHDAVANLAAKGLVEGYPDGTFKGDRACSRWEMAMIIARFLAKNDQEHATFATRDDLEALRKLTMEYTDELHAYGVRVTNLEEEEQKLNKRVTELERTRFYGSFESSIVAQAVGGDIPFIGSSRVPGTDWSSGRLLTNGTAINSVARLGLVTAVAPEIDAGTEFAAYCSAGDDLVGQYWGVTPPYLSNPFLGAGAPPQYAAIQPYNNIPWTRMTLDRIWMNHKPTETKVIAGSFRPEQTDSFVLAGPKNPNIHQPDFLPFYGAKVSSYKKDRLFSYEASFAPLAQDSGTINNYNSWMTSANVGFNFDRGRVSLNYVRALNEMNSFASIQGSGIIPIPRNMRWMDSRRNILRGFVGPQAQNTYGIALNYQLSRTIAFEGEAAQTEYNPDTSKINFNTTATGSLVNIGLKGNFDDRLKLALNYFSISATYDPFLLRYQLPPNLPVFLPYATYYSNYWQLHDSQNYPSNRQGLAFNGSYRWADTELTGSWGTQEQVAASTPSQIQTPGNVEPLFTTLRGGGSEKGKINNWGLGLTHTFPCKLGAALSYYNYDISRPSNFRLDAMSFNENIYYGGLTYPLDTRTNLFGNYTVVSLKGNTGVTRQDFRQDIPAVGASYSLGEKSFISLSYRFFNLYDYATSNSNWHANQTMMEYKVSF